MEQSVVITLDILKFMKAEGYQALIIKFNEHMYVPTKESMEELIGNISLIPLAEDQLIPIPDAILYFDELKLSDKKIRLK